MVRWHAVSAIFSRNVQSYFSGVLGYLFIVVFVEVASIATFSPQFFANNLASLEQLNLAFPFLLLFLVPAISMSVWADERKLGTDELLFTLPASDTEILIGKYFAVLAVYSIALAFSLTQLFILAWLGNPDWGVIFSTYVGYWLAGAALLSAGMFASVLTGSTTVAFVFGTLICAVPVFIGWAAPQNPFLQALGLDWHLRDFTIGLISLSSVLYFVSIIVFMLYLNMVFITRRHWSRDETQQMGLQFSLRAVALAAVLLSANFMASQASANFGAWIDFTSERIYTLADTTRDTIDEAKENDRTITIQAFVSPEVPGKLVHARRRLLGLLRQYDRMGGKTIDVRFVDVEPDSKEAGEAGDYDIEAQSYTETADGRSIEQDVFMGVVVTSDIGEDVLPFLDGEDSMEHALTRSLGIVTTKQKKLKVGLLETDARFGRFEQQRWRMSDAGWTFRTVLGELEERYDVKTVTCDELAAHVVKDILLAKHGEISAKDLLAKIAAADLATALKDEIRVRILSKDDIKTLVGDDQELKGLAKDRELLVIRAESKPSLLDLKLEDLRRHVKDQKDVTTLDAEEFAELVAGDSTLREIVQDKLGIAAVEIDDMSTENVSALNLLSQLQSKHDVLSSSAFVNAIAAEEDAVAALRDEQKISILDAKAAAGDDANLKKLLGDRDRVILQLESGDAPAADTPGLPAMLKVLLRLADESADLSAETEAGKALLADVKAAAIFDEEKLADLPEESDDLRREIESELDMELLTERKLVEEIQDAISDDGAGDKELTKIVRRRLKATILDTDQLRRIVVLASIINGHRIKSETDAAKSIGGNETLARRIERLHPRLGGDATKIVSLIAEDQDLRQALSKELRLAIITDDNLRDIANGNAVVSNLIRPAHSVVLLVDETLKDLAGKGEKQKLVINSSNDLIQLLDADAPAKLSVYFSGDLNEFDTLIAAAPSSLPMDNMQTLVEAIKRGQPVLVMADPVPYFFPLVYYYPKAMYNEMAFNPQDRWIDVGLVNAPRQERPLPDQWAEWMIPAEMPPQMPFELQQQLQQMAQQMQGRMNPQMQQYIVEDYFRNHPDQRPRYQPKADGGKATSLLDALGIEWNNGRVVSDPYNPHPDFTGVWPKEVVGKTWPEGFGSRETLYLFLGDSNDEAPVFDRSNSISQGLREMLMFYAGTVRQKEGSKLSYTPLVQTSPKASLIGWNDLTHGLASPSREKKAWNKVIWSREEAMTPTEKLAHRTDGLVNRGDLVNSLATGHPVVYIEPRPKRSTETNTYAVAAHIQEETESEDAKGVNAVFVTDLDFVSEMYFVQTRDLDRKPDNLLFLFNAIEVLAGDESWVTLRNRRAMPRELTAIQREVDSYRHTKSVAQQEADEEYQKALDEAEQRKKAKSEEIAKDEDLSLWQKLQARGLSEGTEERRSQMTEKKHKRTWQETTRELNRELKESIDGLVGRVQAMAWIIPPIPALLVGLGVLIFRISNERRNVAPSRRAKSDD